MSSIRYGTNNQNTSKYVNDLLNEFNKMPKGVFNETRRKILDVPLYGIIPFEVFEMLPNSDVYLQYDLQLISKNPTVKRLLSSMKAEIAVYHVDYNDTWEAWNNFITKGRSGTVSKSIPWCDFMLGTGSDTNKYNTSLPYNPSHYLNLTPAICLDSNDVFSFSKNHGVKVNTDCQSTDLTGLTVNANTNLNSITATKISALPLVFYNKIVKKYQQPNLLQNNVHWIPENENHDMILPYTASGQAVTTSDYDNSTKKWVNGTSVALCDENSESYPWLNVLQFSQRKGDEFNTGSPFPDLIRGNIPTLQLLNSKINWDSVVVPSSGIRAEGLNPVSLGNVQGTNYLGLISASANGKLQNTLSAALNAKVTVDGASSTTIDDTGNILKNVLSRASLTGLEFSMRQWRALATMSVMKERLALTDGSYNELIKAMFGHNPNWHSHDCKYCGGSTQPIVFSEVVNQTESSFAPLGDIAGRAVSASMNNQIHVHADDFGMYMAVLVIQPDEYFCQGTNKMFSRLENAEQYFPILNNLSPDAIQNKQLYISGTNSTDEDVFNYQERFSYYKSRRNEISGLMSLPISKVGDVGAWVQNRLLGSTPQFNMSFNRGTLTNNEKAIFASTDQAEFCAVIGCGMKFIGPIPEDSRPSDMGISY